MKKLLIRILSALGLGVNAAYSNPTVFAYNAQKTIGCKVKVNEANDTTFTLGFNLNEEVVNVKYFISGNRIVKIEIL